MSKIIIHLSLFLIVVPFAYSDSLFQANQFKGYQTSLIFKGSLLRNGDSHLSVGSAVDLIYQSAFQIGFEVDKNVPTERFPPPNRHYGVDSVALGFRLNYALFPNDPIHFNFNTLSGVGCLYMLGTADYAFYPFWEPSVLAVLNAFENFEVSVGLSYHFLARFRDMPNYYTVNLSAPGVILNLVYKAP